MASTSNTNTEFVMIEAELLDCSVCFERPNDGPILQCRNGHWVCSSCRNRMLRRCPDCRQFIEDIRCLATEKIIESARSCTIPNPETAMPISEDENYKKIWFYEYPLGKETHGPYSLNYFRRWEDYFVEIPGFCVWKIGGGPETAVPLIQLLQQMN
ncbi:hypothetical protein Bca4012_083877 [Brassica carinata]